MVAAGGDSSAGLFEPEEFRDGEHLPAAGTASSVADAAGEQLAVWAAAFGGETLAAAGTFVDPGGGAGSAGRQRGQRCRGGSGGGQAIAVGRLAARGATEASGPAGAQRGAAALAGWRNAGVTPRARAGGWAGGWAGHGDSRAVRHCGSAPPRFPWAGHRLRPGVSAGRTAPGAGRAAAAARRAQLHLAGLGGPGPGQPRLARSRTAQTSEVAV